MKSCVLKLEFWFSYLWDLKSHIWDSKNFFKAYLGLKSYCCVLNLLSIEISWILKYFEGVAQMISDNSKSQIWLFRSQKYENQNLSFKTQLCIWDSIYDSRFKPLLFDSPANKVINMIKTLLLESGLYLGAACNGVHTVILPARNSF